MTVAVTTKRPGRLGVQSTALKIGLPVATILLLLLIWQVSVDLLDVPRLILPSPIAITEVYVEFQGYLWEGAWVTLSEALAGFALAIVVAVPVGMLVASSKYVETALYPLLVAVNAIPKVAIAPLLVVWMGFGILPKIVMVFLMCFFPIVISTATGLRSAPSELVELGKSNGATGLQTFVLVRLPWATQQIFVGLKVAITLAVIGAVIGEFVGASQGLGYLIVQSGASANTALAFAAIGLLALLSIVLFYGIGLVEKALLPWAEDAE
ncbi:ABC transporter permease [Microbacterium sp. 18062]|uniref:ABC transporter permease n=1 Tax=Microbacterium sp. 18062 TaxID=2681410 RepID=UPI001359FA63|nr:ABC transporter permease [Microbacterium sp. 18062]